MNNLIFLDLIEPAIGEAKLPQPATIEDLMEFHDPATVEMIVQEECADLGKIYFSKDLEGKNIQEFIKNEVSNFKPDWVIAVGKSATAALTLKNQRKILLNPKVAKTDLCKGVSDFEKENTYIIIEEENDYYYERVKSTYPESYFFYCPDPNHNIGMYKELIEDIINERS